MRVLVIEDDPRLAGALADGLGHEGFDVDVEASGTDGYWRALVASYDAIVLDLLLPGMNGFKVCERLRREGVATPVLILTAKDGELDEIEGLETGADDYLRKPFDFDVLVARLRAVIRRGPQLRGTVLCVGDLSLDTTRRRCTRAGLQIDLTPREYEVLETLMLEPGVPVPKEEIFDRVWGFDHPADLNVVELYVSYLRTKVDRPFDEPLIHTIRGAGYAIEHRR